MSGFAGTGGLLRLAWRRDRVMIVLVAVVVWLLTYYSVTAMKTLYPSQAALRAANVEANASTGVVAMYGRIEDVDSIGGLGATKLAMLNFLILTFLVIAIVRRHTRAEEETGRFELIGATPVARRAPLVTAVGLALIVSLVTGIGTALCAIAGGWPSTGSVLMGLALVGVGFSFTALTAIAVQLSASNRTAGAWIFGALGAAFVLRVIGDVAYDKPAGALRWLSPLGWGQQVRPFDGDRAWVLVLPAVFAAVCLVVAAALQGRRDLGAGLLPDRPGNATGRLGSAPGLAWRLQAPGLFGWLIGFVVLGVVFGAVVGTVGGLMTDEAQAMFRKMGGVGAATDLYLSLVGAIAALGAAAFGIGAVLRLRAEERSGHLEQVLATPVPRARQFWAHTLIALAGSTALLIGMGLAMAGTHAVAQGGMGGSQFWREFTANLAALPAVWVMTAFAAAAAALLPRFDWLGWAALAAVVLVGELGGLMNLPSWVLRISPFAHVPKLPVEAMSWGPEVTLTVIAAALLAVAVTGYRRRDMPVL